MTDRPKSALELALAGAPATLPTDAPAPAQPDPAPWPAPKPSDADALVLASPAPAVPPSDGPSDLDAPTALALALTRRGHPLLTSNGRLFVANASSLTETDRTAIRTHRSDLLELAVAWKHPEDLPLPEPPEHPRVYFTSTAHALGLDTGPDPNWRPTEPPCLDGIDDIIVNWETNGLSWHKGHVPIGATVGTLDGLKKWFLPWGFQGGNLDKDTVIRFFQREVRNKHITNANTKFEVHMGRNIGVDFEGQGCTVSDVQHYAGEIDDNRRKFSLDVLAEEFLGSVKVPRIDESQMARYHASEVAKRAEYQVTLVSQLRDHFWPQLDKEDLQRVRQLEDDCIYPTVEMERNAAPLDVEMLHQWCAETKQIVEDGLNKMAEEVGFSFSPDSSADWERLFKHCNQEVTEYTAPSDRYPKGQPSFTDKVLKGIDNPWVQLGRKIGKMASLRAKFLVPYAEAVGSDGLLRYSLHQLRGDEYGTVRGRYSASDKNIEQVINKDTYLESFGNLDYFTRKLFIAGKGMLFGAFDAAQIEFRIFGHFTGNIDRQKFGLGPETILAAYSADPEVSFHRVVEKMLKPFRSDFAYTKIKSANFMFIYGGGRGKAASYLELPQDIADQFCDIYFKAFPEVKILSKRAEEYAKHHKFVKSLLGRRARFPDPKFAYKALNAVIQPSAADIFKWKIVELYRERKNLGITLRFPVHDEICMDCPDKESAQRVTELLNRQSFPVSLRVPILWSGGVGANWASAKA